jgi:DNA-binding CsgD family transcriptional regulator
VLGGLSNGERRVADLVARGLTNREVADALRLQPKTVEWTLTNVYRKLGLRSRTELAITVVRSRARAPSKPEIPPADQRDLPT